MTAAVMATTAALTVGMASQGPQALDDTITVAAPVTQSDVDLLASVGSFPVGPGAQIAKAVGLGTLDAVAALRLIAELAPGDLGDTLDSLVTLLEPALAEVEIAVPGAGSAGTYQAIKDLDHSSVTGVCPICVVVQNRNNPLAAPNIGYFVSQAVLTFAITALGGDPAATPFLTEKELPGSYPDALAFPISWGVGGTNLAQAIQRLQSDPDDQTAVLAMMLRNTSRPGGGLLALATPLTELFGVNLSNPEGDDYTAIVDATAAYDVLSDAPTSLKLIAWLNAGVGALMPTYLLPINIGVSDNLADVLGLEFEQSDGNLYLTYNPGNLPLLEPLQALPRLISSLSGFDITTPLSSSFENVLTQLVAMGYQDVNLTGDAAGEIPVFTRGFDMAGVQAEIWKNPITHVQRLQVPQALFNATIDGLKDNLLSPENQELVLGGIDLGALVYHNALNLAIAHAVRDALTATQNAVNPVFDAGEAALTPIAEALDNLTGQSTAGVPASVDSPATGIVSLSSGGPVTTHTFAATGDDQQLKLVDKGVAENVQDDLSPQRPTPLKDALAESDPSTTFENANAAGKEEANPAASKDQRDKVHKELRETGKKLRAEAKKARDSVKETGKKHRAEAKKARDSVKAANSVKPNVAKVD